MRAMKSKSEWKLNSSNAHEHFITTAQKRQNVNTMMGNGEQWERVSRSSLKNFAFITSNTSECVAAAGFICSWMGWYLTWAIERVTYYMLLYAPTPSAVGCSVLDCWRMLTTKCQKRVKWGRQRRRPKKWVCLMKMKTCKFQTLLDARA